MQIVSPGDNMHQVSDPILKENKQNISKCCLLKFLPSMQSIKSVYINH